jgi:hypothetical protein
MLREVLLLAVLSHGATAGAAMVFMDGAFSDAEWSAAGFGTGGFGFSATQQTDGGNPGSHRRVDHDFTEPPVTLRLIHTWSGASYTPSLQGEIFAVGFSIDYRNIAIFGQGQAFGVALLQGGKYFYGSSEITAPAGSVWTQGTASNRQAQNFVEVLPDASVDNASHPDFGPSGSPIVFGFTTVNSTGVGGSIDVGYDNWSVTLEVVPEPSAALLAGLGPALGMRRSRPRP